MMNCLLAHPKKAPSMAMKRGYALDDAGWDGALDEIGVFNEMIWALKYVIQSTHQMLSFSKCFSAKESQPNPSKLGT